ncbi:DNA-binding protein [Alkalihalophilus lindianensis]|uniref:DNA-binding protein n=1 Tax=Alkalihalophilus lindianensis TaxID=1630542 RepID=A0ABU3X6T7_9BACI|nr:DNA-binding protein [Alkalihalophilus lindianensis]MDV2683617.1 DNA-binding protein [Alkalihalophilus lindianensis]
MVWDFMFIGAGIAAAGYFIGEGLKNFKNPNSSNIFDSLNEEEEQLIKENEIHHYIGISIEDAKHLIKEHPNIPHLLINNTVYYPKAKVRAWLKKVGD